MAARAPIKSVLRHLNVRSINSASSLEARSRQNYLPPITTYRWWARRTEAVTGALIDAANIDTPGRLIVADPFTGGGVIALAALLRGHQIYAQDINPWAATSLVTMLSLPPADDLDEAAARLHDLVADKLHAAYATKFMDGSPATMAHTLRVALADCPSCGNEIRLFPTGLVSLTERVDRGGKIGWIACPEGHLHLGTASRRSRCPTCNRLADPDARSTTGRNVSCISCGYHAKLDTVGKLRWTPVLIERCSPGRREISPPSKKELSAATDGAWPRQPTLAEITDNEETSVLRRHGLTRWHHLYPRRQFAILRALLAATTKAAVGDAHVEAALRAAVVGSVEMAGHLSRWDARYLKAYEAVANHRYNFTTLAAEPNVWGAPQSGRGTVNRRLDHFAKAAIWYEEMLDRRPIVSGPIDATSRRRAIPADTDARVVSGSSVRLVMPTNSLSLICTDPPYHDDVHYGELSELFRVWAGMSTEQIAGEAVVSDTGPSDDDYEATLTAAFREMHRALKPRAHLVLSYANREPKAWAALFGALQAAGFRTAGYEIVSSENDSDHSKTGRRSCNLDVILDLVHVGPQRIEQHQPTTRPVGDEARFCRAVGTFALQVGSLSDDWRNELIDCLRQCPFVRRPVQ